MYKYTVSKFQIMCKYTVLKFSTMVEKICEDFLLWWKNLYQYTLSKIEILKWYTVTKFCLEADFYARHL